MPNKKIQSSVRARFFGKPEALQLKFLVPYLAFGAGLGVVFLVLARFQSGAPSQLIGKIEEEVDTLQQKFPFAA